MAKSTKERKTESITIRITPTMARALDETIARTKASARPAVGRGDYLRWLIENAIEASGSLRQARERKGQR